MPAQDGRGPLGQGPRTGRGLGNCKPAKSQNSQTTLQTEQPLTWRWFGRLFGARRGRNASRGRRNRIL
jgi:hypothetical protein